jgi:26S proteasome regulatory subunit N6
VRNLVDLFLAIRPDTGEVASVADAQLNDIKVKLCEECIKWATDQNRQFLRQTLQARLVRLYNDIGRYQQALQMGESIATSILHMCYSHGFDT